MPLRNAHICKKTAPNTRTVKGFTLLEILVALAVAAIGLGAVSKSLYQNISVADKLTEKMLGTWVASNVLAEMHINRQYQTAGGAGGDTEMGGQDWAVRTEFESTGDPEISRINVIVMSPSDPNREAASLFGFISRPKR